MLIELWIEGLSSNPHTRAQYLGTYQADDFDDAVAQYVYEVAKHNKGLMAYYQKRGEYHEIFGCRLFSTASEARKLMG